MSWRVSIRHRTAYRYRGVVRSSYNEARVTPLTTPRQTVVEANVTVSPAAPAYRYWDYWGTMVDAFDLHEPHTELAVTGSSVVETSPPSAPGGSSWGQLRQPEVSERFAELLAPTTYVPLAHDVREAAVPFAAAPSPAEASDRVAEWVRDRLRYEAGATDVCTTAVEALRLGAGVCQDFAHLTLALLRALGIPGRYSSGYVFPGSEVEVGTVVSGQSHAWVEAWTGDWYELDPTHRGGVGERHVVVGRGRDYADVPPLRGIYHGAPSEGLAVTVDFTRLA